MARPKPTRHKDAQIATSVQQAMAFGWCQTCVPPQLVLIERTADGRDVYHTPALGLTHAHIQGDAA